MSHVKIYRPAKTSMQSGRAKTRRWVIEHQRDSAAQTETLMNWTSCSTTRPQVKLTFSTKDDAIRFANEQGWTFDVHEPQTRTIKPKSYVEAITNR